MAKYVVDNYHYDACPSIIPGCNIDQVYAMAFDGCPHIGTLSMSQDCFVGRVTTMANRIKRGLYNDPAHFYPIRVAGYYLTQCIARESSPDDAERYVVGMMDRIFAEYEVPRPAGLVPFTPGNPARTTRCNEGVARKRAELDAELAAYMQHGGGNDKVLNPSTGRYIKRNGKTARKLGIN